MTALSAPAGFRQVSAGAGVLLVDRELASEIRGLKLQERATWDAALRDATRGLGRGATARCALPSGRRLLLKKLRRGGLLGPVWRDRFIGPARLLDNLVSPNKARIRGVSTPAARALLSIPGPPGLYQGWLALDEIPDAQDLATRLSGSSPPTDDELSRVMTEVRAMHEAGVDHRDLNLGNILLSDSGEAGARVFVTDLDGARLHPTGLPFGLRQRALRRLERSWCKLFGGGRAVAGPEWIYRGYAGADRALAERLDRGRRWGRLSIALHRLTWRS